MLDENQKYEALIAKFPNLEYRTESNTLEYDNITWLNSSDITEIEYNDALTEYINMQYSRDRREAYNALNQMELISDDSINGTTTHKDAILAIKAEFPKP
jgi:hypothetical protein